MKDLDDLAEAFWDWRAATQPDSHDDLTHVERPPGWVADWSVAAIAARRDMLAGFTRRYRALDLTGEPLAVQVDGRLVGSALDRVRWELDLLRGWQRNPCFYLDQSLGPVFTLLLVPPPFEEGRAAAIVERVRRVPVVLRQARDNLAGHAAAPFAQYALRLLTTAPAEVERAMSALTPLLPERRAAALPAATTHAAAALVGFRDWLAGQSFTGETAVGAEALAFFLHRVALLPDHPERLRTIARQEYDRAVATETILRRQSPRPTAPQSVSVADLVARQRHAESAVRRFYVERGLLTQPQDLRHYTFAAMPPYLTPLAWLGTVHDVTSPNRVDQDAVRYITDPGPDPPYFQQAKWLDPRTGIVHEGVHAQQMALSWRHADPIRRHYYDSAPNEGIAFYNEELMLLAGLFADAPDSAAFIANSLRLRALRVEVDIGLALGELTLDQAVDQLVQMVPMDRATAWQEAVFFAGNPGQGLSYQIGKSQILDLLATCAHSQDGFDLRAFHDRLWREGNVPLALQRWELLGLRDHLDQADQLATEHR